MNLSFDKMPMSFKAKRLDNNSWVYGSLLVKKETSTIYMDGTMPVRTFIISDRSPINIEVNPLTVCRETPWYDSNGQPVFENDLIETEDSLEFLVYWDNIKGRFWLRHQDSGEDYKLDAVEIFTHPEKFKLGGNIL